MSIATLALVAAAYVHYIEEPAEQNRVTDVDKRVSGVVGDVKDIRVEQLETKLDQAYTALCMRPGDPDLLERVRELQEKYSMTTNGQRYAAPTCNLLQKIK